MFLKVSCYAGKYIGTNHGTCWPWLWQICVALVAGISAKEVVVSSTAVLFGVANINSAHGMSSLMTSLSALGFTSLNAFA